MSQDVRTLRLSTVNVTLVCRALSFYAGHAQASSKDRSDAKRLAATLRSEIAEPRSDRENVAADREYFDNYPSQRAPGC